MDRDFFKEYIRQSEPSQRSKAYAWNTAIHRKLFWGSYRYVGQTRGYNLTKKEWVLDGATVLYGSASELRATLEYDFSVEEEFSYQGLSMDGIIRHLAFFVSRLWQIHVFGDGNVTQRHLQKAA